MPRGSFERDMMMYFEQALVFSLSTFDVTIDEDRGGSWEECCHALEGCRHLLLRLAQWTIEPDTQPFNWVNTGWSSSKQPSSVEQSDHGRLMFSMKATSCHQND